MRRIVAAMLTPIIIFCYMGNVAFAEEITLDISAPSAILMEASTGQVIYEKNAEERLHPASITKIMTLLLIFEKLEEGKISLTDEVTTSAHAKSMGGSQVFLEEGEVQTVDTLIKCIAVASGNDAAVAMAEYIAGSEEEFVKMMNNRAKELGMTQTTFEDCCGLSDSNGHMTTAKDVALMSRELIVNHPEIYNYTQIWMEDIIHQTNRGSSTFTLSSTNKLLKQYEYTTGLKTGSTNTAKYCLSATARKNDIDLIAVVMKAPDHKVRFNDAVSLLNYGFSVSNLYKDENKDLLENQKLSGGVEETVPLVYSGAFQYLDVTGKNLSQVTKEIKVAKVGQAPVVEGQKAGEAVYMLDGDKIGSVDILYGSSVKEAVFKDYIWKIFVKFCL
ncbi:MAG: D-alanyl-D-alanine carboxypeptidase [Lachnospiraceae bacterium]|nr:D-alanyl-D-alanine carboxypeptidase [Lachnospiraceae bacterium]